ncbi:MAG: GNAT family N-acetyltransferase [Anaerolineae bacterium]|jgi:ribosomal protein S18 acetylase RimI-like enzyme|nr:GNAT family N-acetyltransferase [Anaerolineae bacterium]
MTLSIQQFEEFSFRAWPALDSEQYDGWLLRFTHGYTRRANSINPIYGSTLDLGEKIAHCEQRYRQQQLTPCFKLTPIAQPTGLDQMLTERGYQREVESRVMIADLGAANLSLDPSANLNTHATETWLQDFTTLNPTHAPHLQTMRALFERIEGKTYFATVQHEGETASVGLGVVINEIIGLFDIVTREDKRGHGLGRNLVSALLSEARAQGVKTAFLQVAADNAPAQRLYSKLGFRVFYPYWYRCLR